MQSAFSAKPFLFMRFTIIIDSVKLYRKSLCLIFMNFHWPWIYSPLSYFILFFLPLSIHHRQTVLSSCLVFTAPLTNSKQTEAPKYRKISDSSPHALHLSWIFYLTSLLSDSLWIISKYIMTWMVQGKKMKKRGRYKLPTSLQSEQHRGKIFYNLPKSFLSSPNRMADTDYTWLGCSIFPDAGSVKTLELNSNYELQCFIIMTFWSHNSNLYL